MGYHFHIAGNYRGAAHGGCNLCRKFKSDWKLPVIHNLKGCDGHVFILMAICIASAVLMKRNYQRRMRSLASYLVVLARTRVWQNGRLPQHLLAVGSAISSRIV